MNYNSTYWYAGDMLNPENREEKIELALRTLQPHLDAFDCIAVRGFSGATAGSIIAWELNKGLIIVRKDHEERTDSHGEPIEGALDCHARYIVVDDFICSGVTIATIINKIGTRARFVGYYLWRDGQFVPPQLVEASVRAEVTNRALLGEVNKEAVTLDTYICGSWATFEVSPA